MIPTPFPPSIPQQAAAPDQEWRGQYQGDADPGARLIQNPGAWDKLWKSLDRPAPPLDFTRSFAVVAFAGRRPTGGYTLVFLDPVQEGDDLVVRWRILAPGPDVITTQAFAQPWKVKAFPRPKGRIRVSPTPELP